MRFTKNTRLKDKALEFASKLVLLAVTALFCLWMISGARAAGLPQITDVSAVSDANGNTKVELSLSEAVAKNNISVDYQRNFIQFSFRGVSAFPAKSQSVDAGGLEKIFTYQYQPGLARARILLKDDAAKIKGKTNWHIAGNTIVVDIGDAIAATAPEKNDSVKQAAAAPADQASEDKIVKEILSQAKAAPGKTTAALNDAAASAAATTASKANESAKKENEPLFADEKVEKASAPVAHNTTSPVQKMLSGLLTVLVLMAGVALAFRKFVLGKGGKIGGFNFAKQNRLIEVVSSQGIAPKKSISVIRVGDQYFVIGLSGDNISMLTNLDAKANLDKYLERDEIPDRGEQSFGTALSRKLAAEEEFEASDRAIVQRGTGAAASVRSAIKKRIEGFKPL